MVAMAELGADLQNAGKAIGLMDSAGDIQTNWFGHPLQSLETMLTTQTQRDAFFALLDAIAPHDTTAGAPDGELWHPLFREDPWGAIYLTTKVDSQGTIFGVAGVARSGAATASPPVASLRLHAPLLRARDGGLDVIVGSATSPLSLAFQLDLGWTTPTMPIVLGGISVGLDLVPEASSGPKERLTITLQGFSADGQPPRDTVLDPDHLGSETVHVIMGLLHNELHDVAGVGQHLLPLIGIGDDAIPAFPISAFSAGPAALRTWLTALFAVPPSGDPPILTWLAHLVGLFGVSVTTPVTTTVIHSLLHGSGTADDPWHVPVFSLTGTPGVDFAVTLALVTAPGATAPTAMLGVDVSLTQGTTPVVAGHARATLAAIPLSGVGTAAVLPSASLLIEAPAVPPTSPAQYLVPSGGAPISVKAVRGGIRWDGQALTPMLELDDVTLQGVNYPRIDLTHINTNSITSALNTQIQSLISGWLGSGSPGQNLAALACLIAPTDTGTGAWPASYLLDDFPRFIAHPTQVLVEKHRAILHDSLQTSPPHSWSSLFKEIAGLIVSAPDVQGSGTADHPWTVGLESISIVQLELVAWNAQTSTDPNATQQLRLGLRAAASSIAEGAWTAELLAIDLPASGAATLSLVGAQHGYIRLSPVPTAATPAGISLEADAVELRFDWQPGQPAAGQVVITGFALTSADGDLPKRDLHFPPTGDLAASTGLSGDDLDTFVRVLVASALHAWGGTIGYTLSGLVGLNASLPGFPPDFPKLKGGTGYSLLSDPLRAFAAWMQQVVTGASRTGLPFLLPVLEWFRGLLAGALSGSAGRGLPHFDLPTNGAGTPDDPWSLALTGEDAQRVEALVWLEPSGPPASWVNWLSGQDALVSDFSTFMAVAGRLAPFVPGVRDALRDTDVGALSSGLQRLAAAVDGSDGIVPLAAQAATGGGWIVPTGTSPILAAHSSLPSSTDAITRITTQLNAWPAGPSTTPARAVLLLGPAFGDQTAWHALLAAAGQNPDTTAQRAYFNFRQPGIPAASVDLSGVVDAVTYYPVDLVDDGTGDLAPLTAQIDRAVARVAELCPAGTPIYLVAHSTAGLAASAYAIAHPTALHGLITLGTPFGGADLLPLHDPAVAEAVRFVERLALPDLPAGPMRDALTHLVFALNGYTTPAVGHAALPQRLPYPYYAFGPTAPTLTPASVTIPALALTGALDTTLLAALKQWLSGAITHLVTTSGSSTAMPTHIACGIRAALTPPAAGGDLEMRGTVRMDLWRHALQSGGPPGTPGPIAIRVQLARSGGWLLGGPCAYTFPNTGAPTFADVCLRAAEIGIDLTPKTGGGLQSTTFLRLQQGGYHGPALDVSSISDTHAQALLGALFTTLSSPAPTAGSPIDLLLRTLTSMDIVVPDPHGGEAIGQDALAALASDAVAFLSTRLRAQLALGAIPFFSGPASGPWTWTSAPSLGTGAPTPLTFSLAATPAWSIGFGTTTGDGGGIPLGELPVGGNARLQGRIDLALDSLQPRAEVSLAVGKVVATWSHATGQLTLQARPFLDSLTLVPAPTTTALTAALEHALPALLTSSIVSTLLQSLVGKRYAVKPITAFLAAPAQALLDASSLGVALPGHGFDATKVNELLKRIAGALNLPADTGLGLPMGLVLAANPTSGGASPLVVELNTTTPLGGVVEVGLGIGIDQTLHATPQGNLTVIARGLGGSWGSVAVAFGVNASGLTLDVIHPGPDIHGVPDPSATTIHILPTFSGLGSLVAEAESLLPSALNALLGVLSPPSTFLTAVLSLAQSLSLYDGTQHFSGHDAAWKALLGGTWLQSQSGVVTTILPLLTTVLNQVGITPITTPAAGMLRWTTGGGALGTGSSLTVDVGWDGGQPKIALGAEQVKLASGPVTLTMHAGLHGTTPSFDFACGLDMQPLVGISLTPALSFGIIPSPLGFTCTLDPLGTTDHGALFVELLPTPGVHLDSSASADTGVLHLIENLVVPLAIKLLLDGAHSWLTQDVWPGAGKTLQQVLNGAGIIDTAMPPHLQAPLPDVGHLVAGLLEQLAASVEVTVTDTLKLSVVSDSTGLGIRAYGHLDIPAGSTTVKLGLGGFAALADAGSGGGGITIYLLPTGLSPSAPLTLAAAIHATRIGVQLDGTGDAPLINSSGFRLGGVGGEISFTLDLMHLSSSSAFQFVGAGLDIAGLGLPLGQALSGGSSSNPVAASLLRSNSDTSGNNSDQSSNSHPVNPTVDISVDYTGGHLTIKIGDSDKPIWIPIHAGFGPIYIDQIGFDVSGTDAETAVQLLIDGGVHIAAFTGQVEDLSVTIKLVDLRNPGNWTLDLNGVAVSYSSSDVSIAGGLLKSPAPIEYDGMLLGTVAAYGLSVIGSYAALSDTSVVPAAQYTSLFVFLAIDGPIGGPPFLFITGLGGGLGYNRALTVPTEITDVPNFVLVEAIDDSSLAADPMSGLAHFRDALAPQRGSLWLAAGLRFDTFVIVHSVAVVYVELNHGFEVGLLGVSRMQLPDGDAALVSVELALKARYSSTEGILSIQAQLTSNSWLLSHDCMLTGGFAFFIWFPQHQFVTTLGGYHPHFDKPPEFPTVPRLGFHWAISDVLSIKGESYFALTNSCVMAGGRLEAMFDASIVKAWFIAYADFLIAWDPFHYDIGIGISIGAEFSIRICVFGCCAEIDISVSLGAQLEIIGPPLHGTATVELEICTVSFEFGDDSTQNPDVIHDWSVFKSKYLIAGGSETDIAAVHVQSGMIPVEGGGQPPMGTSSTDAWKLAPEWAFTTETRMPATEYSTFVDTTTQSPAGLDSMDIAPMAATILHSTHTLKLTKNGADISSDTKQAPDWRQHITVTPTVGGVPEGTWLHKDSQTASANNRQALIGLLIVGRAEAFNASAQVHIQALVEDLESASKPLPFGPPDITFKNAGLAATQAVQQWAMLTSDAQQMLSGATLVLAGNGRYAQARLEAGRPQNGIPAMAAMAMRGRSAPPLFAPMATGMAQESAGLPPPIVIRRPTKAAPVPLVQPRLRTVLQARSATMPTTVAAGRTTVSGVAQAQGARRMAPPTPPAIPGAKLVRAESATATPPTSAATGAFTLRSPELGWYAGPTHVAHMRQAEAALVDTGVTLAAGMTHIWEITPEHQRDMAFTLSGTSAARITCLGRAGDVLSDCELVATSAGVSVTMPPHTAKVAITCLGQVPTGVRAAGDGAGALAVQIASNGLPAATGWQTGNTLTQVGPITYLGRGAVVRTSSGYTPRRHGAQTIEALTAAADAMRNQRGVETWLPLATSVVMILLDRHDPAGTGDGDLRLAGRGAALAGPPLRVAGGARVALLYEVAGREAQASELVVSVASEADWQIAGVIGLPGRAAEWAARLHGSAPPRLVADGPFSSDGTLTVQLRGRPAGATGGAPA